MKQKRFEIEFITECFKFFILSSPNMDKSKFHCQKWKVVKSLTSNSRFYEKSIDTETCRIYTVFICSQNMEKLLHQTCHKKYCDGIPVQFIYRVLQISYIFLSKRSQIETTFSDVLILSEMHSKVTDAKTQVFMKKKMETKVRKTCWIDIQGDQFFVLFAFQTWTHPNNMVVPLVRIGKWRSHWGQRQVFIKKKKRQSTDIENLLNLYTGYSKFVIICSPNMVKWKQHDGSFLRCTTVRNEKWLGHWHQSFHEKKKNYWDRIPVEFILNTEYLKFLIF